MLKSGTSTKTELVKMSSVTVDILKYLETVNDKAGKRKNKSGPCGEVEKLTS